VECSTSVLAASGHDDEQEDLDMLPRSIIAASTNSPPAFFRRQWDFDDYRFRGAPGIQTSYRGAKPEKRGRRTAG
jgi:hypothetical protein